MIVDFAYNANSDRVAILNVIPICLTRQLVKKRYRLLNRKTEEEIYMKSNGILQKQHLECMVYELQFDADGTQLAWSQYRWHSLHLE